MATSTCVKCGGHRLELANPELLGEAAKYRLVQCASCGVPVGVIDPGIEGRIEGLRRQIASIDSRLMEIAKTLADPD